MLETLLDDGSSVATLATIVLECKAGSHRAAQLLPNQADKL
jgi:hypothetical protein